MRSTVLIEGRPSPAREPATSDQRRQAVVPQRDPDGVVTQHVRQRHRHRGAHHRVQAAQARVLEFRAGAQRALDVLDEVAGPVGSRDHQRFQRHFRHHEPVRTALAVPALVGAPDGVLDAVIEAEPRGDPRPRRGMAALAVNTLGELPHRHARVMQQCRVEHGTARGRVLTEPGSHGAGDVRDLHGVPGRLRLREVERPTERCQQLRGAGRQQLHGAAGAEGRIRERIVAQHDGGASSLGHSEPPDRSMPDDRRQLAADSAGGRMRADQRLWSARAAARIAGLRATGRSRR